MKQFLSLPSRLAYFCLFFVSAVCLAWGLFLGRLITPSDEILVDLRKLQQGVVALSSHKNNGTIVQAHRLSDDTWRASLPSPHELRTLDIELSTAINPTVPAGVLVTRASVNGISLHTDQILDVYTKTVAPSLEHRFVVLKIAGTFNAYRRWVQGGLVAILLLTIVPVLYQILKTQGLSWFIYSTEILTYITKRDCIITLIFAVITFPLLCGCDSVSMFQIIRLASEGIDPYQFQVNHKAFLNFVFLNWPYNPSLLIPFTLLDIVLKPFTSLLPGNVPLWLATAPFKLLSIVCLFGTILGTLSFLIKHNFLTRYHRLTFYLSIFNPLTVYIVILFVQLDAVPLYFISLGILHLLTLPTYWMAPLLCIGFGASMKMQGLMFVPLILAGVLARILLAKEVSISRRILLLGISPIVIALTIFTFGFLLHRDPYAFHPLLNNFAQPQRLWLSIFTYVPQLVLYITPAVILAITSLFALTVTDDTRPANLILGLFCFLGALTALFSASFLYTPSTLIQMTGACTVLFAMRNGVIPKLTLFVMLPLIVINWMLNDTGDLSRLIPGVQLFTDHVQHLTNVNRSHYESLLHTISVTTLGVIGVQMLFVGHRLLTQPKQM